MSILDDLTVALFTTWYISELVIGLISFRNQTRASSDGADRFSLVAVRFSIVLPIAFALLVWKRVIFADGFGSLAALFPLLGYLGCLLLIFGILIRVTAVATLRKQFTVKVSIVEKHEIVETSIYGIIRHPAYLGLLMSLLGMGLASENWVSLMLLIVLPFAAVLYRINVEEKALLRHFGPAYQAYAARTKRLIPRIW